MTTDMFAFAKLLEEFRAATRLQAQFLAEPQTKVTDRGFLDVVIDLSNPALAGSGLPLNATGYGVTYLRRSSSPGGLLAISGMGLKQPFAPGDFIGGWFESGDAVLQLAPGSSSVGTALLRVSLQSQASYREAQVEVAVKPTALLGALTEAGVPTFVTVAENVEPFGPASGVAGAFNISGWRRVIVLIDTNSADGEATSFELHPFYQVTGGSDWFDQGGTEKIIVQDSNPSALRFRTVAINLSQSQGSLYLGIRNLLPAARISLGLCVLGVA